MSNGNRILALTLLLGTALAGSASAQRSEADRSEARARARAERVERLAERARARAVAESRRGWLGLAFSTTEPEGWMAVTRVTPGSPSSDAGLAAGDTIVRWNGRAEPAEAALGSPPMPGESVRLAVRRGSAGERTLTLVAAPREEVLRERMDRMRADRGARLHVRESLRFHLDSLEVHADSLHLRLREMIRDSLGPALRRIESVEMPRVRAELEAVRAGVATGFQVGARSVAGAEFTELNDGLASYFETERGALTLRVAPGTPADRAGLRPGDVVISADGSPISEVRDLRSAVVRSGDREMELGIVRQGARRELRLRWE